MKRKKTGKEKQTPSQVRFEHILQQIRRRITLLDFPPGARLDLDALAAEFEVSRTPIRSVLQRLEFEGLVLTRHGVGSTVTEVDFHGLKSNMEFRARLAEMIGQLNPMRPTAELLAELSEISNDCRKLMDEFTPRSFGEVDFRLQHCVMGVIGHPQLARAYDEMYFRTARMWFSFLPHLDLEAELKLFCREIDGIYQAMERNDILAVGYIIRNSIQAAIWRLSSQMDSQTD